MAGNLGWEKIIQAHSQGDEMNMRETGKRKNKGPNFNVYVGTTFRHEVFRVIEALAASYQLANAQVVRELFLRGLAAYNRDGKLSENRALDADELTSIVTRFTEDPSVEIAA